MYALGTESRPFGLADRSCDPLSRPQSIFPSTELQDFMDMDILGNINIADAFASGAGTTMRDPSLYTSPRPGNVAIPPANSCHSLCPGPLTPLYKPEQRFVSSGSKRVLFSPMYGIDSTQTG